MIARILREEGMGQRDGRDRSLTISSRVVRRSVGSFRERFDGVRCRNLVRLILKFGFPKIIAFLSCARRAYSRGIVGRKDREKRAELSWKGSDDAKGE